jgi:hypothetical protein
LHSSLSTDDEKFKREISVIPIRAPVMQLTINLHAP